MTLTKDTTITGTWTFTENTIVKSAPGQIFTIDCKGNCAPTFLAQNCQVHLQELRVTKIAKTKMASTFGANSKISWNLSGMRGAIKNGLFSETDAVPPSGQED